MPHIVIPQTGTAIYWPHNDLGRIRVRATLDIGPPGRPKEVPVEISLKPQQLRKRLNLANAALHVRQLRERMVLTEDEVKFLLRWGTRLRPESEEGLPPDQFFEYWADNVGRVLRAYAERQVRSSLSQICNILISPLTLKKRQSLEGHFSGIDYRLVMDRDNLRAMGVAMAEDEMASGIMFQARWYLVQESLNDLAFRNLPRGRNGKIWTVRPLIRCAVFCARELLLREDRDLQRRIWEISQADWRAQILLQLEEGMDEDIKTATQRRLVMALADRALRPALRRHNIRLAGKDISSVLDAQSSREIATVFARYPDKLTWWFDLLLGPEGEVARRFHLI